jgi:hypothetical protein
MFERMDHWTPPDSLGYSSLRPVRLSGLGRALVVGAVLTLAGGVVLAGVLHGVSRRQNAEHGRLVSEGISTDARITRVWRTGNESGDSRNRVAYTFDYAGRNYSRSVKVPGRIWRGLAVGDNLKVHLVPSEPAINHPVAWSYRPMGVWVPYLVAPGFFVAALLMLLTLRCQLRLLTEGRPAPGHVTGIRKSDKFLVVRYEFPLLSGAVAKGKYSASKVPAADKALCILYDPENPRRNAPYPLSLVRLETQKGA